MKKICFLIATAALAQNPWPPGMHCSARTVVRFDLAGTADQVAALRQEHLSYLLTLMKAGKVMAAGPMDDHQHAMIVFTAKDWADVEAMLKDEPFMRNAVLRVASHEVWTACQSDAVQSEPAKTP